MNKDVGFLKNPPQIYTLHGVYHLFGYCIPRVLKALFVEAPLAALESVIGKHDMSMPKEGEGAWVMVVGRHNATAKRDAAKCQGVEEGALAAMSAVDFFGFTHSSDPILREQHFSNEKCPCPGYGGHYHTIMGNFRREYTYEKMRYQREEVHSGFDGCRLVLEWRLCEANVCVKGVIAIVPGLASTCLCPKIQRFILHAVENGFHCVVLETRGVAHPLTGTSTTASANFTHDVDFLFRDFLTPEYMKNRFGDKDIKLMAVGFALGGCVLLHHLGKAREATRLHCAMTLCSPYDLHSSVASIDRPAVRMLYQPPIIATLEGKIAGQARTLMLPTNRRHSLSDINTLRVNVGLLMARKVLGRGGNRCQSLVEFDAFITCPSHGYKTPSEYYTAACPFQCLHAIEVPTLCFATADDPIVGPPPTVRRWDSVCEANPNLVFVKAPTGGHLGFVGTPIDEVLGRPNYVEKRMVRALATAAGQARRVPVRRDVPDSL